jgi:hypothetical protein
MELPPLENGVNGAGTASSEWPIGDSMMEDSWEVSSTMTTTKSQQYELLHVRRAMEESARNVETKINNLKRLEESAHARAKNAREKCISLAIIRRDAANFSKSLARQEENMQRRLEAQRRYNQLAKIRQETSVKNSGSAIFQYRRKKGDQFRLQKEVMGEQATAREMGKVQSKRGLVHQQRLIDNRRQHYLQQRQQIKIGRVQAMKQNKLSEEHSRLVTAQMRLEKMKEQELMLMERLQKAKEIKSDIQQEYETLVATPAVKLRSPARRTPLSGSPVRPI